MWFELRPRERRSGLLDVRLRDSANFRPAYERQPVDRRDGQENLSGSQVRPTLRKGIGDGRERLHFLQVQGTGLQLSASDRMQETVRFWLQDEQTRLSCEYIGLLETPGFPSTKFV